MSEVILETENLTKKYKHTLALDHISLQIEQGKGRFIGTKWSRKNYFIAIGTGLRFQQAERLVYGENQIRQNCRSKGKELAV